MADKMMSEVARDLVEGLADNMSRPEWRLRAGIVAGVVVVLIVLGAIFMPANLIDTNAARYSEGAEELLRDWHTVKSISVDARGSLSVTCDDGQHTVRLEGVRLSRDTEKVRSHVRKWLGDNPDAVVRLNDDGTGEVLSSNPMRGGDTGLSHASSLTDSLLSADLAEKS
jgi:hypothetical protein